MVRHSLLGLACLLLQFVAGVRADEPFMRAHYINVGQGASTLLEFPCGAVLIDTGAQDDQHVEHLAAYLETFFQDRPDLNNTLSALYISHPHVDHSKGIPRVCDVCRVANYLDDGVVDGSGKAQVKWIRDQVAAGNLMTRIREIKDDEITSLPHKHGLTDDAIDPVACPGCDPKIVVLQGGLTDNPGWSERDFRNWNNHSLVVRVDFGESSFLFTGDLEEAAQQTLIAYYRHTQMLDVDVYLAGHHGSYNGTTEALVEKMTPEMAVFGVGRWNFGQQGGAFTTFAYGHPRKVAVDLLSQAIPGNRSTPRLTFVFTAARSPVPYTVTKQIYATGWDGDIVVRADLTGNMQVETRQPTGGVHPSTLLARPRATTISPSARAAAFGMPFDSVVPRFGETMVETRSAMPPRPATAVHTCPRPLVFPRLRGW